MNRSGKVLKSNLITKVTYKATNANVLLNANKIFTKTTTTQIKITANYLGYLHPKFPKMIEVGKTVVARDVFKKEFVCNISACKGECCISGDAGAPLTDEEHVILKDVYPKIKHLLRPEGIEAVEQNGTSVFDTKDQEYETPLIDNAECAYVIYDEGGTALCAIEKGYNEGLVEWIKPISCHLYPIRIKSYRKFDAINYESWDICADACSLGQELQVPVYRFLKEPLIRKYGADWYNELAEIAVEVEKQL